MVIFINTGALFSQDSMFPITFFTVYRKYEDILLWLLWFLSFYAYWYPVENINQIWSSKPFYNLFINASSCYKYVAVTLCLEN